ncbi:MAG: hypothetical protein AAFW95_03740 [Cyanobacteria bacterium J06638_6]
MVSSAVRSLTPWLQPSAVSLPGAMASTLSHTVCRMVPLANRRSPLGRVPVVAAALGQLVQQSMGLRSPTGGWPADLPQTPEHLEPYLSDEIWELLEALEATAAPTPAPERAIFPISTLVPDLLWMLASGGYEIMRLIEGVQARVYAADGLGAVHVVRLVPVLRLTLDETDYDLDLVTQTAPATALYLAETTQIRLLENDLDSQPLLCGPLLERIAELVGNTQPGLTPLLGNTCAIDTLRPFQSWQPATLTLHLHLAEVENQGQPQLYTSPNVAMPDALYLPPKGRPHSPVTTATSFTLDDFANTLVDGPDAATAGGLGGWLTFTDETWIQAFLSTCAQQVISQNLSRIAAIGADGEPAVRAERQQQREAACNLITYRATDLVQGASGLFKHTFVHEPVLVADVWPRLRWYLAQSSERVMQLMGGVMAQVLAPGLSWQQGSLYLRPLLQLTTPSQSWIVDLSRGRILPTPPQALSADAVVDVADDPWSTPLTVADLTVLVDYDLTTFTPAIAALGQGTPIHLHRLDGDTGCQTGKLTLDWCFTLQTTL